MPSSIAGEMPPSTNATIVHSKQKLQFYRIVRITLVVEFGPSSASYVIMETITLPDSWILMEIMKLISISFTISILSIVALMLL
jgi:hypothetical protein